MDSHVRTPAPRANVNTELFDPRNASAPPDLRQAYTFARSVARAHPDGLAGPPGHRLIWVRRGDFGSLTLVSHPETFVVVGRHTRCGFLLSADPSVALRHLLVRSVMLPSGGLALRMFDLHTSIGFLLADGSRQTSVFAEGPVAVAIGEYALVALPADAKDDELPEALPPPQVSAAADGVAPMQPPMSPYRSNARPHPRASRITLMPRLVMLGEALPPRMGRLATGGPWGITLERDGRSAAMALSDEDLVGGVLIGRSEKCHAEMLRRITADSTSRAHVLVLREGPLVCAYDLASTHGTYQSGARVRRIVLADTGTLLTLGPRESSVRMYWHRIAA